MSEFQVGDIVVIREDSVYYGRSLTNPDCSVEGEVYKINHGSDYLFRVRWSNGSTNTYRPLDLRLVKSHKAGKRKGICVFLESHPASHYSSVR